MTGDKQPLRYERIPVLTRQEALVRLAAGGTDAANAIYSVALHDEDDAFAERTCLEALHSGDPDIRFAAVGALGEMAFFGGRTINFVLAETRLLQLQGRYPELSGRIEDALDDIALALGRRERAGEK